MGEKINYTVNYNVDDYGVLRVYRGNAILFEIQDCGECTDNEIRKIINEELYDK